MIDVDDLLDELETADVGDTIESLPSEPLGLEAFDGDGELDEEVDRA